MTKAWLISHLTFCDLYDLDFFPIKKFSHKRDSLNIFLCIAPKFIPYIHFTYSSEELEIGQDSDRN